ncbi:MAG: helix-turn-helix transcriptional regulator [Cyanobacteria bacterium P01_F01_bin.116]
MATLDFSADLVDGLKSEKIIFQTERQDNKSSFILPDKNNRFLFDLLNNYMDGILVLSTEGTIVYVSQNAQNALDKMNRTQSDYCSIPREIDYVFKCQSDIRNRFPEQNWSVKITISTNDHSFFDIQTRWIHLRSSNSDCLLFVMEDSNQQIKEVAIKEAKRYGLTPRETEVWLLHQLHHTYKQIAEQLDIRPNTVKKHMRSILTKQRFAQENKDAN